MDIKAKVKQDVRKYITDNILMSGGGADLTDDSSFLQRNILDSTGVLEVVNFLQDTFQVQIADEEMVPENLDSLNAIAAFVERKKAGGSQ